MRGQPPRDRGLCCTQTTTQFDVEASPSVPGASMHEVPGAVPRQGRPSHLSPRLGRLQHVKFVAVTSFLCLRFFSPAIMTPKLFHLRETHADARTSRTLLLLAKVGRGGG